MEFTDSQINCPMIAAVLLGKYNRAGELKCAFEVDFNGGWETRPVMADHILTIFANLLDNAIDAAKDNDTREAVISVGLYEDHANYYIKVEDSGRGLPPRLDIFQKGVSTKSGSRGIGLYNVSMALKALNASIKTSSSKKFGGAHFDVIIPKMGV